MTSVFSRITALLLVCTLSAPAAVAAQKPVAVVATFSVLADMVSEVGGEHVAVTSLVGVNGDAHVYSPRPADARAVKKADLLVMNGLGFEGWLERLVESADFEGTRVIASQGITPLPAGAARQLAEENHHQHDKHDHDDHAQHDAHERDDHHGDSHHGDADHAEHDSHDSHDHHDSHEGHNHGPLDPHAWHDIANAQIYIRNIAAALAETDPAHAADYRRNADDYAVRLQQLDQQIRQQLAAVPATQRKLVTNHDSLAYLAHAYQLQLVTPQAGSTEAEASAADLAKVIRLIRQQQISAIFLENIADPRLIEQISRETGAAIGGQLYSDALSGSDEPADTYYGMMRHNAQVIATALSEGHTHERGHDHD